MSDETSQWLVGARAAVERAIRQLVDEFIEHPFTHRREHSLHVDLYHYLIQQAELMGHSGGYYPIGKSGYDTRLVHKEWPTTVPATLRNSTKRLQSYDIGVLSPFDLAEVASTAAFRKGKPPARIAIELSLDYSFDHMAGDIEKFRINMEEMEAISWAPVAYLVHFTRVPTGHADKVEALLRKTVAAKKINATFAELTENNGKPDSWRVWHLGAEDFA